MNRFLRQIMIFGALVGIITPNLSIAQDANSSPIAKTLYEIEQTLYDLPYKRTSEWGNYADSLVATCVKIKSPELSANRPEWVKDIVANYCEYSNEFTQKFKLKKSGDSHRYCKPLKALDSQLKAAFQSTYGKEYRVRIDYAQLRAERSLQYKNYINSDKQGWYGWKTYNFDCSGK